MTGPETPSGDNILEAIRLRANADNTVSDGRYGREREADDYRGSGGGELGGEGERVIVYVITVI